MLNCSSSQRYQCVSVCVSVHIWPLHFPPFPVSLSPQRGLGREELLLSRLPNHSCNHLALHGITVGLKAEKSISGKTSVEDFLLIKAWESPGNKNIIRLEKNKCFWEVSQKCKFKKNKNQFWNNGNILPRKLQNWLCLGFPRFEVPDNWNASLWAQESDSPLVELLEALKYSVLGQLPWLGWPSIVACGSSHGEASGLSRNRQICCARLFY